MTTDEDLMFKTISQGLQASFEAINEVAKDLSEPRKAVVFRITKRVLQARHELEALIDMRRS